MKFKYILILILGFLCVNLQAQDDQESTDPTEETEVPEESLLTETVIYSNVCQGEHLIINGQEIHKTGVYYDTLKNHAGLDSVRTFVVNIYPTYHFYDTLAATTSQIPFEWQGQELTTSGTYEAPYKAEHGCDSVYHLYIRFLSTHLITFDTTVCQSELPVFWRGRDYYQAGIYSDPLQTIDHVDSVYQMNLHVIPKYEFHRTIDLCEGTTIYHNDRLYDHEDVYIDSLQSVNGCDSVEIIHVRLRPAFEGFDEARINDNEKYVWQRDGKTYDKPGNYTFRSNTQFGCDSVWHLHIELNPSYLFPTKDEFCQSEELTYYTWRGKEYSSSGVYYDSLRTQAGQDSIYRLELNVYPYHKYTQFFNLCEGGSLDFGGHTFTGDTIVTDSLLTGHGCDSIVTTIVRTHQAFHHYDTVTISNQEVLQWHGQTITQSGNYFDYNVSSTTGCDSTYQLNVTVYPVYIYTTDTTICQTETPYIWRDHVCDQLGTHSFEEKYTTVQGYDSIYRLNLTVNPAYQFDHIILLCPGSFEEYRGKVYDQAGEYLDTLRTGAGCDSIAHIHVSMLENFVSHEYISINDNESYTWPRNGETYSKPGTYEIRDHTQQGCDSLYLLTITRNPKYFFPETVVTCALDTLPFYIWRGRGLSETGIYWDSLSTAAGQDSVYKLDLTINERFDVYEYRELCRASDAFTWHKMTIDSAGEYLDTLQTKLGCDSVIHLIVNSNRFELEVFDTICYGDTLHWMDYTITRDTFATKRIPGVHDCDSIFKLHVTMFYPFEHDRYDTICETKLLAGEQYLWGEDQLPLPLQFGPDGHYKDSTFESCDHSRFFHLHVLRERIFTDTITICQGDSVERIMYDGSHRWFKTSGRYYDTIPAYGEEHRYSCDSVVLYYVQVHATSTDTITKHVADKTLPYLWKSYTINQTGYYSDTASRATFGCDSITVLHLIVDTTYLFKDSIKICRPHYHGPGSPLNTPYIWEGHKQAGKTNYEIYNAGIYWDSLRTKYTNVDSVYMLKVDTFPIYHNKATTYLCRGDSLKFADRWIHTTGTYMDTLKTIDGCDSIVQLTVNLYNSYFVPKDVHVADNKLPYLWHVWDTHGTDRTHQLSAAGVYEDTLQTALGCDSIVQVTLFIDPTYEYHENAIICASETPYKWHNKRYWTTGVYVDSLQTVARRDSVHYLHLTVNDTTYTDLYLSICRGHAVEYNGKRYDRGGVYLDTLTSQSGCDSIMILRIREAADFYFSDTVAVSNRQPYTWRGEEYTHTGIYQDAYTSNVTGCDSIYELVLTVYDKDIFRDTTIQICENELPFRWKNKWISEQKLFYDTVSVNDVDTIWQVDLRVQKMEYETIERVLCAGDEFAFNGKIYTRDTLAFDTVYTGTSCGKQYTLFLRFRSPRIIDLYAKTRSDKPYTWTVEDKVYTYRYSGDYQHIVRTSDDSCDSLIYNLHLSVGQVYFYRDSMTLCQNDLPYVWHGQQIYEAGIYWDSLQTVLRYDSVYMLNVKEVYPAYYTERVVDLCEKAGSFIYRGKEYNENIIFYDTIPSVNGCDSIFRINVRVHPAYAIYDTVHISDKQTYQWELRNGDGTTETRELSKQGPYEAHLKTYATQCDSTVYLQLYVHPSYLFEEEQEICDKDTFYWHNRKLYKEGVYYDSLLTIQGYDSIYKLNFTVHKSYFFQESVQVCPNRTTYLHGIDISQPGVYYDTLPTQFGCDSVYRITVNWTRTFKQEYNDTVCQGTPYYFFGVPYTRTGTYKHEIGCDSSIIVHLTVLPNDIVEKRVLLSPEEFPYRYKGSEYYEAGMYRDTLTNRYSCDSIFILNIIETQHYSEWYQIPLCPGSEIRIDTMLITKSGLYSFVRKSEVTGKMDSLYRVHVYDAPAYDFEPEVVNICQGDTFMYCGKPHTRSGHYDYNMKTKATGCDSIMHLVLNVYPRYQFYTDATIADYQTYNWFGSDYSTEGDHDRTFLTVDNCDSTYTLRLKVVPTERFLKEDSICNGQHYTWRGQTFDQGGYYTDTVLALESFYSAIYSLHLTEFYPTNIINARVDEVCADQEEFEIYFSYSGGIPTAYSVYFDQFAKNEGFKDVINAPFMEEDKVARVPMPKKPKVIYQEHTEYVRPDYYSLRLVLDNGVCGINRSDSLILLVKYPSWIIEQNWQDVVAPLKSIYNGGYEFAQSEWYVNDILQPSTSGYLYNKQLKEGDQVIMVAKRKGESVAIPTCPLIIQRALVDVYDNPILIYPTSAPRHMPTFTIETSKLGEYTVYSAAGMKICIGTLSEGQTQVTLPGISGIYFIRTTSGDEPQTQKVMVY